MEEKGTTWEHFNIVDNCTKLEATAIQFRQEFPRFQNISAHHVVPKGIKLGSVYELIYRRQNKRYLWHNLNSEIAMPDSLQALFIQNVPTYIENSEFSKRKRFYQQACVTFNCLGS